MIKFKQGYIRNPKTGKGQDIVVKAANANSLKENLIGVGLVMVGIIYLTNAAFRNGSQAFEQAELQAFEDLDLFIDD